MSNVLYRVNITPETIFQLAALGYTVEKTDITLDFNQLEDMYTAAIYRKLSSISSIEELEQQFVVMWLKHKNEKVELVNLPKHLKMFTLPEGLGIATPPVHLIVSNQRQIKEGVSQKYVAISIVDEPIVETNKVPDNILEEFAQVASLDVDTDLLPLLYAQHHYQNTKEVFYKNNLLWIIQQVMFVRNGITGIKVPISKTGYVTIVPNDSWGVLRNINSYVKSQILKEIGQEKLEWTTAQNQHSKEGLKIIPEPAPEQNYYDENQFIQYLFSKVRPDDQGNGTIPFDIPVDSLLQQYLYETFGTVSTRPLVVPERRELVTKLNAYHATKYHAFLKGRKNTPELILEYFGASKHPASSDAAIKRGQALFTIAPKLTLLDNQEIIF